MIVVLVAFWGAVAIADDTPPTTQPAQQSINQLISPWTVSAPAGQSDPVGPIANQMRSIVGDLSDAQTGESVQIKQRRVVRNLDVLIKELERQTKSGSGAKSSNPTSPMEKSMISKGPGGQGPLHDPKAGTRTWDQLPPKERDQIMQSQTEGFPPGYESVLSSYYSRLAQGQTGADGNPSAPAAHPTTQP